MHQLENIEVCSQKKANKNKITKNCNVGIVLKQNKKRKKMS